MHFVAVCLDKPDGQSLRLANRAAHLDYLRANSKSIPVCGPMLSDDGQNMIGSLLIVQAGDKAAAEKILAEDPYRKAGLFSSVDIHPWRWVVGTPGAN
jgi:uncharacterized protein YciI